MTFKEFWAKQKKGFLIDRVEGRYSYTRKNYKFDRYLLRGAIIFSMVLLGLCFLYGYSQGYHLNELYVTCPGDAWLPGCLNPCYQQWSEPLCEGLQNQEFILPGGSIGKTPDMVMLLYFRFAIWGSLIVIVKALLYNHWKHNREVKE